MSANQIEMRDVTADELHSVDGGFRGLVQTGGRSAGAGGGSVTKEKDIDEQNKLINFEIQHL